MKYKIWNKTDDVVMSNGLIYTADEWKKMHPIAKNEDVRIVCGGGIATGKYFEIYDDFIMRYEELGCDFTECETEEDCLIAIEEFEKNNLNSDDMERVADALEDLVVLNMPEEE